MARSVCTFRPGDAIARMPFCLLRDTVNQFALICQKIMSVPFIKSIELTQLFSSQRFRAPVGGGQGLVQN